MGTLVFQANLGGAVNLVGPNTASTVNFTLPSADGSSGQALVTNGSGTLSFSSFVSAAAGSNTQVQFNSSGAFAGSANLTFNGTTLTAANTSVTTSETLSYGTANGVAYLNGSKVVTTGSALTFDGTNLSTTGVFLKGSSTSYSGYAFQSGNQDGFAVRNAANNAIGAFFAAGGSVSLSSSGDYAVVNGSSGVIFGRGASEDMRLTSTGLGIGTSSPSSKLHLYSASGTAQITQDAGTAFRVISNNGLNYIQSGTALSSDSKAPLVFTSMFGVTEWMRLDSSGNLGLGVTPSAWGSGGNLQVSNIGSKVDGVSFVNNAYNNAGWKYASNGYAQIYAQDTGRHIFYTAASGTAGNAITFTQAMTLDASGNLQLGATSGSGNRLNVVGTGGIRVNEDGAGTKILTIRSDYAGVDPAINVTTNNSLLLMTNNTERARITSGGDLLVGKTSAGDFVTGVELQPGGAIVCYRDNVNAVFTRASSDGELVRFNRTTTKVGSIDVTTSATSYNTSSDYRLKDNQQPLTGSGAFIDALQPKTWDWKETGKRGVGFIAHEVQAVSPGSVVGEKDAVDEEGNPIMQAMEYGSAEFIANIIAELQSLRKRVAQLEAK